MSGPAHPATLARLNRSMGVQVLGAGSFVPDQIVTNEDLETRHGFDPAWILQRTGIRERRHAPPGMAASHMAIEAARRCLSKVGADARDVDLLLVGTFTPDMTFPSTACLVQHALGLNAPAVDMQAACAGFMYALTTAMQFVKAGSSRLALVIGCDVNSRVVNPRDIKTYPLFGDGAGAVLVAPGSSEQGFEGWSLGADGGGGELLCRPVGGSLQPLTAEALALEQHYMKMDGRAVFKWAVRLVEVSCRAVLDRAGKTTADIDLALLHQANIRILDSAAASLGLDAHKVFVNLDRYGNTSAGSIPLCLDEALAAGRIHRGDRLLLCGFGAGLTWGTGLLRW